MMQSTPELDVRFWLARLDMQYILGLFQLINTGINEYVQYQQAKAADYQRKYMAELQEDYPIKAHKLQVDDA